MCSLVYAQVGSFEGLGRADVTRNALCMRSRILVPGRGQQPLKSVTPEDSAAYAQTGLIGGKLKAVPRTSGPQRTLLVEDLSPITK